MAEERSGDRSNLRHRVSRERTRPQDLRQHGKAGLRVLIDDMLESHHGRPREEWLSLGQSGLEVLHSIASGVEPHHFRRRTIGVLGVIRADSSIPILEDVARDQREDVTVRMVSVQAIGEVGSAATTSVLVDLLGDENVLIRLRAAEGLGKVADERALVDLRKLAREDPAQQVREAAASAAERVELARDLRGGRGAQGGEGR